MRPKKKKRKKDPNLILVGVIRKVEPNWKKSSGILGKLGKFIMKIRKVHLEGKENLES